MGRLVALGLGEHCAGARACHGTVGCELFMSLPTSVTAPLRVTVPTVCLCTVVPRRCQRFENGLFPALLHAVPHTNHCWTPGSVGREQDLPSSQGGSSQVLPAELGVLVTALPAPFADNPPAATKSKTSEDIAQSSKYSPAYSPDPYYHSESEYWSFQGSPKGNSPQRCWRMGNPIPAPKPSYSLGGSTPLSWV